MKTLKCSLPTVIWILLMAIGMVFLSNSAARYGQYREEAWHIIQPIFIGSILFWAVAISLILQTVLNIKPIKNHIIIECILSAIIIGISIFLFHNFAGFTTSYQAVVENTNPTEKDLMIASYVSGFRKEALIYMVLSIVAAISNVIIGFTVKNRDIA